ncbi:unnamed protein product [Phytomonas sp. EM1]|nr:unnamed protein product [Phytomonas sp. EM1]|eukprot:CCW61874.1 unnamed protein product [Phytomonas sp. isolate EM1]
MPPSLLSCAPCSHLFLFPALRRRSTASLFSHGRLAPLPAFTLPPYHSFTGLGYFHGRVDRVDKNHYAGETSSSSNASNPFSYGKSFHAGAFHGGSGEGARYQSGENRKAKGGESRDSASSSEAEEEERGSENAHCGSGEGNVYGSGTATSRERRGIIKKWENAFFGRKQYEQGMRERFREAVNSEAQEELCRREHSELFPRWSEDEEAPLEEFLTLPATLQLRYIINRLTMGERRIRYAIDYGSLSMMYQLNLGELMIRDAERLLNELDWSNDDVRERIDDLKAIAVRFKYDYDLD